MIELSICIGIATFSLIILVLLEISSEFGKKHPQFAARISCIGIAFLALGRAAYIVMHLF